MTLDSSTSVVKVTPEEVSENLRLIEDLKFFLATAPANWQENQIIRRYYLNHDEGFVSCVFWNNLYFVTGTDIVRCIVYKFELFGREILDRKKFEEGIFSDLRALKCGSDAVLEGSKSPFLKFLYKNSCLRTQKKQKVFFWFSVPHDRLFVDALERDLKKELQDQSGTTRAISEPALSFKYDQAQNLHDQLSEYVEAQTKSSLDEIVANSEPAITPGASIGAPDYSSQTDAAEHISSSLNLQMDDPKPQTYLITKEGDQTVLTPGGLDDDFPLDYFPPNNDPAMIDPSVFFSQPESFDNRLLIDQTYIKTPYNLAFDKRAEDEEGGEDYDNSYDHDHNALVLPTRAYYHPAYLIGPPAPGRYTIYPPQTPQPEITNGEYYDSQTTGKPIDLTSYQTEHTPSHFAYYGGYAAPPPPASSMYHHHFFAQAQSQVDASQAAAYAAAGAAGAGYYYEPPYYQGEMEASSFFPHFINDMEDDGDGQPYDAFEIPKSSQIISPFGRFFPSFEATAPPTATKGRFSKTSTQSRLAQPSKPAARSVRIEKPPITKKKIGSNKAAGDTQSKKKVKNTIKIVEPNEKIKDHEHQERDNEEYNTLPTPESTAEHFTNNQQQPSVQNVKQNKS